MKEDCDGKEAKSPKAGHNLDPISTAKASDRLSCSFVEEAIQSLGVHDGGP